MEVNGVVVAPDPRLREECAKIEKITPDIKKLAKRMKKIMFDTTGCGLAAPQVGELVQMVIIDVEYTDKKSYDPYVLINPVIVERSDKTMDSSEGCLSLPGVTVNVKRSKYVVVEAYNLDGDLMRYEAENDLLCCCLQHEIDHLHGITMFERLDPADRIKALRAYEEAKERGAKPGETA